MADPLVGQSIGPFAILGRLGAGAMGVVYKARYTNGALVALKLMSGNSARVEPDSVARFEREAKILQQLKHERIVRLYGTGRHNGSPYYAMEFVHGENLAEILHRKGKLAWQEVAELGRQLCEALQHAHDHGVVHRDLKPSNLMIAKDGSLKLADFGIAKDLDQTQLTSANCAVGTAAYMAPEQCRAQNITPRTDLYSLGVVMFELLTGTRPFSGESSVEIFQKHLQEKLQKPSRLVYDIPAGFDTLVLHLMEKIPDRRPPDARTVADSLTRLEERQEGLQQVGATRARRKTKRSGKMPQGEPFYRSIWVIGPAALAFLAGMVFFGWWIFFCPPSPGSLAAEVERLDRDGGDEAWRALAEPSGPAARYMALYSDNTTAPRIKAVLDRAQARESAFSGGIWGKKASVSRWNHPMPWEQEPLLPWIRKRQVPLMMPVWHGKACWLKDCLGLPWLGDTCGILPRFRVSNNGLNLLGAPRWKKELYDHQQPTLRLWHAPVFSLGAVFLPTSWETRFWDIRSPLMLWP